MATYQVMMTFEVPQLVLPRTWKIRRVQPLAPLRLYGGSGRLAVQATVREESPADAVIVVAGRQRKRMAPTYDAARRLKREGETDRDRGE